MPDHKYLVYTEQDLPTTSEVNKLLQYVLNVYSGTKRSIKQYKRMERINISWTHNGKNVNSFHSFNKLSKSIKHNRKLDSKIHNLPSLNSDWIDQGIELSLSGPFISTTGAETLPIALEMPFGDAFPIQPAIDREGAMFSSFQLQIQNNVLRLHREVVDQSHKAADTTGVWLSNLRMLVNESIALIDITLHQLYFMAEYKPSPNWVFSKEKLGERAGRRLIDKFKWITQITGNPLDDAEREISRFKELKDLRNHLNHFDPPCFAYTIEDVANWLNIVPDVGRLLWKIRKRLDVQLSDPLIQIILLPEVSINPRNAGVVRPNQKDDSGYSSAVWK